MCLGCFSQLILRDEFHAGGLAGLLGAAVGRPSRRAFMAYSIGGAATLGAGALPAFAADDGADLILRGGTIRPLAGAPVASAIAVRNGKVLAVGDESALAHLKSAETRVIDLDGRTMLPGLIDPHNHTILAALIFELLDDVGYAKYPTRAALVAHLKEKAAAVPGGHGSSARTSTTCCRAATSPGPNSTRSRPTIRSSSGTPTATTPASTARRFGQPRFRRISAICRAGAISAAAPTAS